MRTRTSFLSMLLVVFLVSTIQAVSVSYQNDVGGYTDMQVVGFDGNPTAGVLPGHGPYFSGFGGGGVGWMDQLATVPSDGARNHIQLMRFDNIFGDGPGQIPEGEGVTIDSATLTLVQSAPTSGTLNYTFDAYRALLDWTATAPGVALYDTDPGNRPAGPDRFSPDHFELSTTFSTSTTGGINDEHVFDITTDLQYFLDNPLERFGWGIAKSGTGAGAPVYTQADLASVADTLNPLLQISYSFPPVPEPSSFLLLGLGAIGLGRHTRRRRRRA